ncbi:MAG: hypothetical protein QM689_01260 [Oscillospiraceae bacterium]
MKGFGDENHFCGVPKTDKSESIYRSDDAGATWTAVANPTTYKNKSNQSMKPLQGKLRNGYLYVTFSE